MKTKDKFALIVGIAMGLCVIFTISILLWGMFEDEKEDDYCLGLYPSEISETSIYANSWSESGGVESGYIRCCRRYYENHESQSECEIFIYND